MTLDKDNFQGALLGLATGDALGTTVEFSQRETFEPLPTHWLEKLAWKEKLIQLADQLYVPTQGKT